MQLVGIMCTIVVSILRIEIHTFNFPSGHCDNSFLCAMLPHRWCCHGKED